MINKLRLLTLLVLTVSIVSCASIKEMIKEPDVKYDDMKITAISLKDIDLQFNFQINNPNSYGVTLTDFDYQLEINNASFLDGEQTAETQVPASGSGFFQVPVRVNYSTLYNTVRSLSGKDEAPYRIKGTARVKTPIGPIGIPFSASGNFPLFQKPTVKLSNLKVEDLSMLSVTLLFDLEINNPNVLKLDISRFNHSFAIAGNQVVESVTSDPMTINKNSKSELSIPVKVNFGNLGSAFRDVLNGRTVNYQLRGDAMIDLPGGPVTVPYDQAGTIDIER